MKAELIRLLCAKQGDQARWGQHHKSGHEEVSQKIAGFAEARPVSAHFFNPHGNPLTDTGSSTS